MAQFDFTKARDEVIANVGSLVSDKAKNELLCWFKDTALPYAEQVADAYVTTLKKEAENETGWCKVRDSIVLPLLIETSEFLTEKALTFLADKAKEEEAAAQAA